MKVRWATGQLVTLLACGSIAGQDMFSLGIEGPGTLEGDGELRGTYVVTLGHTGSGPGAEGWSFGVAAYAKDHGARIVSATTAGTAADLFGNGGFRQGGLEKTELLDPAKYGYRRGFVSFVVLSLGGAQSLPANATYPVASFEAEFDAPIVTGSSELRFESELVGSGSPVGIQVFQQGFWTSPVHSPKQVALREGPGCCHSSLNLGFSTRILRGAAPFDGVEGVGPECEGSLGTVDHTGPATQKIYVNVITQLESDLYGVEDWSLSIPIEGDGEMLSATTAGTTADWSERGGLYSGGFNKTQVIDPALNEGRKGAVSSVVLSLLETITLPPVSTESVLALELTGPEGSDSILSVADGLRGSSQPVPNVLTYGGDSYHACNRHTARITIRHLVVDDFIRGDANADADFDIADAVWILNALFHDGPPWRCPDAADANDDGRIDISDAVHLIRYLFLTGNAPPAPFPECGLDGTEDDIDCPGGAPLC